MVHILVRKSGAYTYWSISNTVHCTVGRTGVTAVLQLPHEGNSLRKNRFSIILNIYSYYDLYGIVRFKLGAIVYSPIVCGNLDVVLVL